ncbi:hypothetical protein ACHAWF_014394, partial [Thalassiosira exigua]
LAAEASLPPGRADATTATATARAASECAILCLGACEGLGRALRRRGTDEAEVEVEVERAGKKGRRRRAEEAEAGRVVFRWEDLLPPTPPPPPPADAGGGGPEPPPPPPLLPREQAIKIATESSCSAASSILHLTLVALAARVRGVEEAGKWTAVPDDEFHFASEAVRAARRSAGERGDGTPPPEFRRILFEVALPCVVASLFPGGGPSYDPDGLRRLKLSFSVFWDGARRMEDLLLELEEGDGAGRGGGAAPGGGRDDGPAPPKEACLALRRDGIAFALRALDEIARRRPDLANAAAGEGARKGWDAWFDRAASSALRAAGGIRAQGPGGAAAAAGADGDEEEAARSRGERALLRFHEDVGDALDAAARRMFRSVGGAGGRGEEGGGTGPPPPPASYHEYRACRSIHRWRILGPRRAGPFPIDDEAGGEGGVVVGEGAEAAAARSALAVVHLILRAQRGPEEGAVLPRTTPTSLRERIVSRFEDVVVRSSSSAVKSRCRSLLATLDLPWTAQRIMRSPSGATGRSNASGEKRGEDDGDDDGLLDFSALASILSRCLAPLEPAPAARADRAAKAAALHDAASEADEANARLREAHGAAAGEVGRLPRGGFDRKASEVVAAEAFAQAASYVGMRRLDRKEVRASVEPQLLAADLLYRVATRSSDRGLFEGYQLRTRCGKVSHALEASGRPAEACAALAMAAWCSIESVAAGHEGDARDDSTSREILLFPESAAFDRATQDGIAPGGLGHIVKQLTQTYIRCRMSLSKEDQAADRAVGGTFSGSWKKTFMGKILEASCSSEVETSSCADKLEAKVRLSKLLHCAVWNKKRFEEDLSVTQIMGIVRQILECATHVLLRTNRSDEGSGIIALHVVEELNLFLLLQRKRLEDAVDADRLQVLSSSFHLSFAARLVRPRFWHFPRPSSWIARKKHVKVREDRLLQCSRKQMKLSEKLFASAFVGEQSAHDIYFFAQWAAVQLHLAILTEHGIVLALADGATQAHSSERQILLATAKYVAALNACRSAVRKLGIDEEVYSAVVGSLSATLKRLLCWFSCHGDPVLSTECCILLQATHSYLDQPQSPLQAISSPVSVSSKWENMSTILTCKVSYDKSDLKSGASEFNCMLQQAVDWTLKIIDMPSIRAHPIPELDGLLWNILETIEADMKSLSDTDHSKLDTSERYTEVDGLIETQSCVATMLILHAKLSVDVGHSSTAARYLGWCHNQLKKNLIFLRDADCQLSGASSDDILAKLDDLLTTSHECLATVFSQLGIRRKAEDHALMAVMRQKILDSTCQATQLKMQDLIDSIGQYNGHECFLNPVRTLVKIVAYSASFENTSSQQIQLEHVDCPSDLKLSDRQSCISRILSKCKNVLAYDDCLRSSPRSELKTQLNIGRIIEEVEHFARIDDARTLVPSSDFTGRTMNELKLRIARDPSANLFCTDTVDESMVRTLKEIASSKYGSGGSKAEAVYKLGLVALSKARDNGELEVLWCEGFDGDDSTEFPHTVDARKCFRRALDKAPPASFTLTKNILRCLALVTGPGKGHPEQGLSTASLVNISVGGTSRNIVQDNFSQGRFQEAFQLFDDESLDPDARLESVCQYLKDSAKIIPANWNICTLAMCPTGEVLISSLRSVVNGHGVKKAEIANACIFPSLSEPSDTGSKGDIQTEVLAPLDTIIERAQKQMRGMTESLQESEFNEESCRRKWWKERHSSDEDLQELLSHAESAYFGRVPVCCSLVPDQWRTDSVLNDDNSECSDFGRGNLASRFERAVDRSVLEEFDRDTERLNLSKLTVKVIKSNLASFGVTTVKKMRKADLIELLLTEMEKSTNAQDTPEIPSYGEQAHDDMSERNVCSQHNHAPDSKQSPKELCVILVLDENLLRFPFESMEMFKDMTVTRVPSLPFALVPLLETDLLHSTTIPMVDAKKVNFVIDPEANLSETASTLGPALMSIAFKNGWEWKSVSGHMPSMDFMLQSLSEEQSLYLYCGHGGGEKAFNKHQVEELIAGREDGVRGCRASVVLMGCSSGKLQSVNVPKECPTVCGHTIYYEPEGIALSYILAGSPCVVGTLWDVTDRDIDRYCLALMEEYFPSQDDTLPPRIAPSLAKCVAKARRACKLRYLVGSAPVCYGVPVVCS